MFIFCCFIRNQVKDTQPLETTVWDPPFEEEVLSIVPTPPPASEELKPSLSLPTCLKDIRVRVTHVTSPGNIFVQLLQFDSQLKRCLISIFHILQSSDAFEVVTLTFCSQCFQNPRHAKESLL